MEKIFDNTEVAFALKSNKELNRAYFLFKLISSQSLVKMGTSLTTFAINTKLPVKGLIKSTVFDHFCGGVNEEDCPQLWIKCTPKAYHLYWIIRSKAKKPKNSLTTLCK